jgi:hypothetical protein
MATGRGSHPCWHYRPARHPLDNSDVTGAIPNGQESNCGKFGKIVELCVPFIGLCCSYLLKMISLNQISWLRGLHSSGFTRSLVQISARRPAMPTERFRGFLTNSRKIPGCYFKLDHISFIPLSFQFIIHLSFHSTLYILVPGWTSLSPNSPHHIKTKK